AAGDRRRDEVEDHAGARWLPGRARRQGRGGARRTPDQRDPSSQGGNPRRPTPERAAEGHGVLGRARDPGDGSGRGARVHRLCGAPFLQGEVRRGGPGLPGVRRTPVARCRKPFHDTGLMVWGSQKTITYGLVQDMLSPTWSVGLTGERYTWKDRKGAIA